MEKIQWLWSVWSRQARNVKGPCYFCISTKKGSEWKDHYIKWPDRKRLRTLLSEYSSKEFNLYFCPNPLKKPQRLREYVIGSSMLWADLDEAAPDRCAERPSVAWRTSPNRYSALWFLTDFLEADEVEAMNKEMTYRTGADKGCWNLTRVLRIPATANHKYRNSPVGKLLWYEETKIEGIRDAWEKYRKQIPRKTRTTLRMSKPTQGKRSEVLFRLIRDLLEAGIPPEATLELVRNSVWNKFRGRRDEARQLEREIEKAKSDVVVTKREKREDFQLGLTSMADVEREEMDWLWYPYFARKVLTLVEGDPGLGKSYFMQMVGKAIVDGEKMPNGERLKKGKICYFGVEDDPSTVVKGRLADNECQNQRDYIVSETVLDAGDEEWDLLIEELQRIRPDLVVFDPLTLYIGGADMHKANETTQVLERFAWLAKEVNCCVVGVRHLTKGGRDKAIYRGQGSISFVGTAREVLTVGVDPEEPDVRVVAVTKLNIEAPPKAVTYTITKGATRGSSEFSWEGMSDLTSSDIIGVDTNTRNAAMDEAKTFLRSELAGGAIEKNVLEQSAEGRSITERTLYRAATELGIVKKRKFGGKSFWSLPED